MNPITLTWSETVLLWRQSRHYTGEMGGVYQYHNILGFTAVSGLTFDPLLIYSNRAISRSIPLTTHKVAIQSEIMSASVGGSPLCGTWDFRSHHDILRLRDQELCRESQLHSIQFIPGCYWNILQND